MSILAISIILATYVSALKKKYQIQIQPALALPELNCVGANDLMISMKTNIILSLFSLIFIVCWVSFSFYDGFMAFNFCVAFQLILNFTPPIHFFGRCDKFKVAMSLVNEMFH